MWAKYIHGLFLAGFLEGGRNLLIPKSLHRAKEEMSPECGPRVMLKYVLFLIVTCKLSQICET